MKFNNLKKTALCKLYRNLALNESSVLERIYKVYQRFPTNN